MGKYDDIMYLEHPTSTKHPRMALYNRAAQFSPFAALTGHEDAINETARLTKEKIELDEDARMRLDEKLQAICEQKNLKIEVMITYFVPDVQKAGGRYETVTGIICQIDAYRRTILMNDRTLIEMDQISEIESKFFDDLL